MIAYFGRNIISIWFSRSKNLDLIFSKAFRSDISSDTYLDFDANDFIVESNNLTSYSYGERTTRIVIVYILPRVKKILELQALIMLRMYSII